MRRRWLLKWEVRATFLKNWTTACLSVDGTETIEGTIDAIWEETTSELISLSEEWTWSIYLEVGLGTQPGNLIKQAIIFFNSTQNLCEVRKAI